MCTVVIRFEPDTDWPIIIAANRDERADRPCLPPARHWPDRPEVRAGLDETAGGTWLGINDDGLLAAILNRPGTLGPQEGKRSRGELPLEALDQVEAQVATDALLDLNPQAYRAFNMVIADRREAYWLYSDGDRKIVAEPIPEGISMITAHNRNDETSPRIRTFLPRFEAAKPPNPDNNDWEAWIALLSNRTHSVDTGPRGAMSVVTDGPFGTVSSSLIALPSPERLNTKPKWLFSAGRPGDVPFNPVAW